MDKNYTVVSAEDRGEAQFGARRYQIEFEGGESASGFSKYPLKPGDVLFGHIEQKGEYHNWKFGKKENKPSGFSASSPELKNILNLRVIPMIQGNNALLKKICDHLEIKYEKPAYPQMDETNDMVPLNGPEDDGIPF